MSSFDDFLSGMDGAGKVVLAETSAENFQNCTSGIIDALNRDGYDTIIITMNNPSKILKMMYEKSGINTDRIYFIDAITRYALGSIPDDEKNVFFISQPGNLTDIGIELNRVLGSIEGSKTCVIVDSINTMLIYVPTQTLTKFIHFMSNKLRLLRCLGIYISIGGSVDPMLLNQLKSISDEFVEI